MVASARGGALAIAAPVAASAAAPSKATPTTTTTTKPGKNAAAIAKLVIKPDSVGHVTVNTSGGSTFKPAKNGQSLHVGDTVQTDATGKAEIDYADTAYTRLDVDTTFTIKKLTDDQGNRQVEGSLDVGRTYNRTAALTQSQTFQQDGGGATAAVAGTAFVVTCSSATTCTFTAVIDNINLTGTGGQTKTLNPLDECVDTNGALCGTTTRLTPDELALLDWIQQNVYLDLAEHGIGDGVFQPFAGTVVITNGQVQSFTPATPDQGFTPTPNPPGPPPAPTIDSKPICFVNGSTLSTTTSSACVNPNAGPSDSPAASINTIDDASAAVVFYLNGSAPGDPNGQNLSFIFDNLGGLNAEPLVNVLTAGAQPVVINNPYPSSTQFTFTPPEATVNTQFTYHTQETTSTGSSVSPPATVPVTTHLDCPPNDEPSCGG